MTAYRRLRSYAEIQAFKLKRHRALLGRDAMTVLRCDISQNISRCSVSQFVITVS